MMRMAIIGIVAALLAPVGCDENKSPCRRAAEHYLSERTILWANPPFAYPRLETVEEVTDYCEETGDLAVGAGCTQIHGVFMDCLGSVEPQVPGVWADHCDREIEAMTACLDGRPYEFACDDGQDNDGDGVTDCYDQDCIDSDPCWPYGTLRLVPQIGEREVDLLFVIDNAGSMAARQANLRTNFNALLSVLEATAGGMPNLHLGVTSTDLGTGAFQIGNCELGDHGGNLLTGNCTNPTGAPYIIDVEPEGCEIVKEPDNTCSAHDCSQTFCAHEPSTTFVVDPGTGCPRCRNFAGESLDEVFSCIADLSTSGCGFGQPLEAMVQALALALSLDTANASNLGFLRPSAHLAVVFVSDEDDCSASDPQLFDDTQSTIDSVLGPLTSYRCFEFGVTCDINARDHRGTRQSCVPRADGEALLHPISRYVSLLQSLKDPTMLILAAIAGPVQPSPEGVGHNMVVTEDDQSTPELQYSCTTAVDGGTPGIRLFNLIDHFNSTEDLATWAYSSICSADYTPALAGIGHKISSSVAVGCLERPPKGCADVGVEFGSPRAPITCSINERCLADCVVEDIFERGAANETRHDVPPCLEVMTDGTLAPGNTDRSLAYANGHPPKRDASLPVSACWHISYNELCPQSRYAQLVVSRPQDPPLPSVAGVACRSVAIDEHLCHDEMDNDEDCLTDADDPCCQSNANCVDD